MSFMALPGEGDRLQSEEEEEEPWSMLSILEDLENWEAMPVPKRSRHSHMGD